MKKINSLRKRYSIFFYKGYSFAYQNGDLKISFDFSIPPDIQFHPKVVIKSVGRKNLAKIGEKNLENLVFHLGLMEIPSYWKATCSPEIVIEAGALDKKQIQWWKSLILKGMGEFFYQNKINFTKKNFLTLTLGHPRYDSHGYINVTKLYQQKLKKRTLIPVGGGKDAVVTLELLKKAGMPLRPFLLNPKPEQEKILSLARYSTVPGLAKVQKPIIVERTIDPKLLELNRKGYLNGHTPFSAYLAFLSVFTAVLFDYRYIAFSNERSSNEGNVQYLGEIINHQYSKSFEFEKKFREYTKKYLAKDIEYFSFLRPLYELQIARIFARYPKYFPAFLSCNEAHKTYSGIKPTGLPAVVRLRRTKAGKWCGKCAKCLFVFAALYPFIEEKLLVRIFGKNLFEDSSFIPLMEELMGNGFDRLTTERRFKPFECVGTIKESIAAFFLATQKEGAALPVLLQHMKNRIMPGYTNLSQKAQVILLGWNKNNFLPPRFSKLLRS